MIEKDTVYALRCDNCGNRFYDRYGCNEFRHDDDMLEAAARDGWVRKETAYGDFHFCCEECLDEFLTKKGEL